MLLLNGLNRGISAPHIARIAMLKVIHAITLLAVSGAQPIGVFKATWASSGNSVLELMMTQHSFQHNPNSNRMLPDPVHTALPWLLRHLPCTSTSDSCPNEQCACGATGRVTLNSTNGRFGFGLHAVLAAGHGDTRLRASGEISVSELELRFDHELHDMSSGYKACMDNHVALYAGELDRYVHSFRDDGSRFLPLAWGNYFSLIVHIPHTQIILEIVSNTSGTALPKHAWHHTSEVRHAFLSKTVPDVSSAVLVPLHVSRAVDSIDSVITYYQHVFGFAAAKQSVSADGTRTVVYDSFPTESSVQLQYVQRPGASPWLQQYLLRTNLALMKSRHNNQSCWPIWGDNHAAFFTGANLSTDTIITNVRNGLKAGIIREQWAQWHGFLGQENGEPGFGHTALYITEPSGWQLEVNAPWHNPPNDLDVDVGDFSGYCLSHC